MRKLTSLLVFTALVTLSCAPATKNQEINQKGQPPTLVEVEPVVKLKIDSFVEMVGSVRAVKQSVISAEVKSRVVSFTRKEGEKITADETVLRLDDTKIIIESRAAEGQYLKALAEEEKAKLDYVRASKLFDRKIASEETLQNIELALKAAVAEKFLRKAEYDRAIYLVSRCEVKAPYTGYLARKIVDVGEWVSEGDPLFEAVDIHNVEIVVASPDKIVGSILPGLVAEIRLDGFPDKLFSGPVIAISPKADQKTRTFLVKIGLTNEDGRIKAGMVARARLEIGRDAEPAIMIPRDAVVWRGPNAMVFTLDEKGVAKSIPVSLGRQSGRLVEATGALDEGVLLVVTGNEILRDDSVVRVAGGKNRN